jgi:ubiquinone/menaquinone biosynthesis C-methylase UbiE
MPGWDNFASYYDLYYHDRTADIDFWVDCVTRLGFPILEFSCGTGRLTFPMARTGASLVGLDISRQMLRYAKQRLHGESNVVKKNVTLLNGNATSFHIPHIRFRTIVCPWGFPAVTQTEQESLFGSVNKHLLPRGHFIVDIINFQDPAADWQHFGIEDYKYFPKKKVTIIKNVFNRGSRETKIGQHLLIWDIVKEDGQMRRILTEITERLFTKKEMERLLRQHGFTIIEEYGNYDKSRWLNTSPRTIIVAQKE